LPDAVFLLRTGQAYQRAKREGVRDWESDKGARSVFSWGRVGLHALRALSAGLRPGVVLAGLGSTSVVGARRRVGDSGPPNRRAAKRCRQTRAEAWQTKRGQSRQTTRARRRRSYSFRSPQIRSSSGCSGVDFLAKNSWPAISAGGVDANIAEIRWGGRRFHGERVARGEGRIVVEFGVGSQ